jgi:hypothetical protein
MDPVLSFLNANWTLLATYPWQFATCAVLAGSAGIAGTSLLGRRALTLKDAEIGNLKAIAENYKSQRGASPTDAQQMLVEMEKRFAAIEPRLLTGNQAELLGRRIAEMTAGVIIVRDSISPEMEAITIQTIAIFEQAHWTVHVWRPIIGSEGLSPKGVTLIDQGGASSAVLETIRSAFRLVGIEFGELQYPEADFGLPQIVFSSQYGRKPT